MLRIFFNIIKINKFLTRYSGDIMFIKYIVVLLSLKKLNSGNLHNKDISFSIKYIIELYVLFISVIEAVQKITFDLCVLFPFF